jgi:hypothetical protein
MGCPWQTSRSDGDSVRRTHCHRYCSTLQSMYRRQLVRATDTTISFSLTPRIQKPVVALQYADDTMLLSTVKGNYLKKLIITLHCFSVCSGLRINNPKSTVIPFNVPDQVASKIQQMLDCATHDLPIKYLSMSLSIRKPDKCEWLVLIEKIERRLAAWIDKQISRGDSSIY